MKRAIALLLVAGCSSKGIELSVDASEPAETTLLEVALAARAKLEPRFRAQFRADLGAAYARAQNAVQARVELGAALDETNLILDAGDRDRVLGRIGRGLGMIGDVAQARELAQKIGGQDERSELLAELVRAPNDVTQIPSKEERDRAYARLATADAVAGEIDRAGLLVQKITDENLQPPVMGAIITAMLQAGRAIDASRVMGQLAGLSKSEAIASMALWAAAKGDTKASNRHLRAIESDLIRARTLARAATLHPVGSAERKRLTAAALKVALELASADLRNGAVEAVARAFAENVDPVTAAAVLEAGLSEPVRNQPGIVALDARGARRVRTLVAESWAATGAVDQAARQAEQIDDSVQAADAWVAITRAAVARGNLDAALSAASRIVHDELRLPAAAEIAAAPPAPELSGAQKTAMVAAVLGPKG